jgi:MYXO-CTERM domain-containing protein
MKSAWLICVLSIVGWSIDAEARSFRTTQYPNGSELGCGACHLNAGGGGARTGFGEQVFDLLPQDNRAGAAVPWADLAALDGDSDGYSNGLELGDPDGTWMPGDPNPASFTNPADPEDNLCGDGILNGNEECDGDPMGATCADEGLEGDTVTCNDRCLLDYSACTDPNANNGNNTTANNTTGNNAITGNNVIGNNVIGNNATTGNNGTGGNNATTGNNSTGGGSDDMEDDDSACSTAGSTPGMLVLVLGGLVALRRRRRG